MSQMLAGREIDNSWNYERADTKEYNHGIHSYPAMMIPQVSRRLLKEYGKNPKVLLDPFLGSGSVLVEGMLTKSITKIYGIEINPLGVLISKVKTTPLDIPKTASEFNKLKKAINNDFKLYKEKRLFLLNPTFKNIDFWFSKDVINQLSIIKKNIQNTKDKQIRDFFLLCFSDIIRTVSYTRNSEFKLYRMDAKAMEKHKPDVLSIFFEKVSNNIEKMQEFTEAFNKLNKKCEVHILPEDTRYRTSIPDSEVDLIVTSPPYGDSRTTVAYGQFSRLSSQWLDYDEITIKDVDKRGLGGIPTHDLTVNLPSDYLKKTISLISEKDGKRAKDVLSFFVDFDKCVNELNRVVKPGGRICLVLGNRTVKEVWIETDYILAELFVNKYGYNHIKTIIREIPTKKMPRRNSPTNIKGQTISTMNNEYIVILEKPS